MLIYKMVLKGKNKMEKVRLAERCWTDLEERHERKKADKTKGIVYFYFL